MPLHVKICGVTTSEAAAAAAQAGADAVGFVFAESPRRVDAATAARLAECLAPGITRVAVFRYPDPSDLEPILEEFRPDVVQAEPTDAVVDVVGDRATLLPVFHDDANLPTQLDAYRGTRPSPLTFLLEAAGRGGRGVAPDWGHAKELARRDAVVLAGGLSADNVARAIRIVAPYGVDVSSGVEDRPGHKDPERIAAFVRTARDASRGDT